MLVKDKEDESEKSAKMKMKKKTIKNETLQKTVLYIQSLLKQ
jgi:hypothetical protein